MIRFRRGAALLNKVVKTFDKAVDDLEVAVLDMNAKQDKLDDQLWRAREKHARFEDENYDKWQALSAAKTRALTVRANIARLVGAE